MKQILNTALSFQDKDGTHVTVSKQDGKLSCSCMQWRVLNATKGAATCTHTYKAKRKGLK